MNTEWKEICRAVGRGQMVRQAAPLAPTRQNIRQKLFENAFKKVTADFPAESRSNRRKIADRIAKKQFNDSRRADTNNNQ